MRESRECISAHRPISVIHTTRLVQAYGPLEYLPTPRLLVLREQPPERLPQQPRMDLGASFCPPMCMTAAPPPYVTM